jgi:hypothetical protein
MKFAGQVKIYHNSSRIKSNNLPWGKLITQSSGFRKDFLKMENTGCISEDIKLLVITRIKASAC